MRERSEYVVVDTRRETDSVTTLLLTLSDGSVPLYTPGQCITLDVPCGAMRAARQYSISSAPDELALAITVEARGISSRLLSHMKRGERLMGSLPHGTFAPLRGDTAIVMIAGGIGITPFRSMIVETLRQNPSRPILLLRSIRARRDRIFARELEWLSRTHGMFHIKNFVTREYAGAGAEPRRMALHDLPAPQKGVQETEFLICGSVPFVADRKRDLLERGVLEQHIRIECFF
jgi:ferredoxin-NADP reductase